MSKLIIELLKSLASFSILTEQWVILIGETFKVNAIAMCKENDITYWTGMDRPSDERRTHIHRNVQAWKGRVEFCERHLPSFRDISYTNDNDGDSRIIMFTVMTQHLRGNSVTELIDRGLEIEKARKLI